MAKVRSPNYPLVNLSTALNLARKLYENDGRNKISKEALASHLGHDGLSGPALGKIGALRAYGLVEGNGDENRISEDAITALMAPDESEDKMQAMRRMAYRPGLFREISKDFTTPPSDSNLRYWLVKRGFSPDGAAKAAKTYLSTVALVTVSEAEYGYHPSTSEEEEAMLAQEPSRLVQPSTSKLFGGYGDHLKAGFRQEIVTLDQGEVTITFPENLSKESFEDLEDHLQIFLRKMKRRINAKPSVVEYSSDEEDN